MNSIRFGCRGFLILSLAIVLLGVKSSSLCAQPNSTTPANFKIAFIGDQGLGLNSEAVLNLIKNEGAHAVVLAGDFDYEDNPPAWDDQINRILGENFPFFALIGNHDEGAFFGAGGYQSFMIARMNRLGIVWQGDLGVQSFFTYQGVLFVMTAPGVNGAGHETYIRDVLAADNSIWSISSWHRNMQLMQVGDKSDDTGWGVYEESRKGGAIIATAHEHSYSRTHLLSNFQNQTVASTSNTLILTNDDAATPADEGNSFAFVSGLGGKSIRSQALSGNWWASIYTKTQGAVDGALFGVFNANGVADRAEFYFKAVDGATPDNFVVISNVSTTPPAQYSLTANTVGSGSVSLNPSGGLYNSGTPVTLTATPEAGYQFSGWSGDLSGSANPATLTMNANKTVTATFTPSPPQYVLTANTVGSGSVLLNPAGGVYDSGTQVALTATPDAGFQFSGWSGDLTGPANPATLTMDANKNVTATFTVIDLSGQVVHQETMTGSSSSSTTVITSASLTAMSGQLYLAAISMDAKVAVSSVSGLGLNWTLVKTQCSGKNKTGIEVWMAQGAPSSSGTVTATFVSKPSNAVIAVSRYANVDAVTPIGNMTSGNTVGVNGACSGGVDGGMYSFNLNTTLNGSVVYGAAAMRDRSHTPGAGYTERADLKNSKAAVAVEDKVMASASATILDGTFSGSVDWAVIGLEIRPQSSSGTQYTLTTNVVGSGSITPSGGSYSAGAMVTLTATPAAGYQFDGWSGALSGSTNPATLTMDANKNVTATFSQTPITQYILTVNTTGSGNVALNPTGGVYDSGTPVTLTATPEAGYQFSGWSGDLSGASNPATLTMNANKTVTATFTLLPPQYTLTINTVGAGSVASNPSGGVYNSGTMVTLTATPSSGYQFSGWSGDLSGSSNPATITMDANKNVTATFTVIDLSGQVVHQETATGSSSSSTTVATSASLTAMSGQLYLAAISMDAKVAVSSVSGLGLNWTLVKTQCSGKNKTGIEVWMAQGAPSSGTVTATFVSKPSNAVIAVSRYANVDALAPISNMVSGNTVGVNGACAGGVDGKTYSFNLSTTLNGAVIYGASAMRDRSHTPGAGYTERADLKKSKAAVAVEDKVMASASATILDGTFSGSVDWAVVGLEIRPQTSSGTQYMLTTNVVGSGSVAPAGGSFSAGATVTLSATPASGYQFAGWSGDLSGTTNPATLTMDANKSVVATFTQLPITQYSLTVNTAGAGSVALNPPGGVYDSGTVVTLTATPNSGFQFSGWSGDLSGTTNPATLTMNANKNVTATFTAITPTQYILTINTNGSGSVALNPTGGTYDSGTVVTLTATPNSGFQFAGWSGDLSGTTNPATLTMNANKNVTANFSVIGGSGQVVHEETVTGGSSASTTVATATNLTGATGHLYLAAISARSNVSATSVSGLGLTWTRVLTQCSGRNITGVDVWMAQGTPTGNGVVTATLASAPNAAVIIVSRYSGVDAANPLGALVSGNTAGGIGACSGGVDNAAYAFNLTTSVSGAMVYGAIAVRNKTNTPGAGYTERGELMQAGSSSAALAVQDQNFAAAGAATFNGTTSGAVDWAVMALEIKPQLSLSKRGAMAEKQNLPPAVFVLEANYPNPFAASEIFNHPGTAINFSLPSPAVVRLNVYDVAGQLVRVLAAGEIPAGRHSVSWNGRGNFNRLVAAGAYLYQIIVETEDGQVLFTQTRRMTLLK